MFQYLALQRGRASRAILEGRSGTVVGPCGCASSNFVGWRYGSKCGKSCNGEAAKDALKQIVVSRIKLWMMLMAMLMLMTVEKFSKA